MAPPNLPQLLVLGGSAGSWRVTRTILAGLGRWFQGSVLVVIHGMGHGQAAVEPFDATFLQGRRLMRPGTKGCRLQPGTIVLPDIDRHLVLDGSTLLSVADAPIHGCRPSIDALFDSVARSPAASQCDTVAVLMSGYLNDGARGLRSLADAGAACLVQSPAEAEVPDLPRAGLAAMPEAMSVESSMLPTALSTLFDALAHRRHSAGSLPADRSDPGSASGSPMRSLPSGLLCPRCDAPTLRVGDARLACLAGHAWSLDHWWQAQGDRLWGHAWTTLEMLEERMLVARARRGSPAPADVEASLGRAAERLRAVLRELAIDTRHGVQGPLQRQRPRRTGRAGFEAEPSREAAGGASVGAGEAEAAAPLPPFSSRP